MNNKLLLLILLPLLTACGGSGGEESSSDSSKNLSTENSPAVVTTSSSLVSCSPTGATVTISGTIQYERVPFSNTSDRGLDYNNAQTLPVRGVVVEALGDSDCLVATTDTSNLGTYSLVVEQDSEVKIRVKAKLLNTGTANWDFEVRDNTRSNGLYVLDGSSVDTGTTDSTRNLTATTGWGGSAYTGIRASAPFAILDSVYDSVKAVEVVDADVVMDDADIFWSENNSTASGDKSAGEIGTSHYTNDQLYILGKEDSDTDEFDEHVIIHEWGHYFEDNLSRSDSIGGSHSVGNLLDMRVALGEGFGNAFSAIVTNDPIYRDSYGSSQATDFDIDVDENNTTNPGWFSESSVQSILYDIHDSDADSNDAVNLGFSAIYDAMTSNDYIDQSSMTSLFSLIDEIKSRNAGSITGIDNLVTGQTSSSLLGIDSVSDKYGTGESHGGYDTGSFLGNTPVYSDLSDDGSTTEVCSHKTAQEYNGLGVRQFLRLNVLSSGSHAIRVTRTSGNLSSSQADPDFALYLNGNFIGRAESSDSGEENATATLSVDEYILEVYEYSNVDNSNSTGGSVCFDVSVAAA